MVALAGCTQDVGEELPPNEHWPTAEHVPELPVHRRKDVLKAGLEELSKANIDGIESFAAVLQDRNLKLESVEEVAQKLSVEYVETALETKGTFEITGLVAGAFTALIDAGFETKGLELVFFEPEGSVIGVVEVATEWAVAFNRGDLSAGEFGELIAGTVESRRVPPERDIAPDK